MLTINKLLSLLFLLFLISLFIPHSAQALLSADGNGDGKVDGVDYVIWFRNYNQPVGNGAKGGDFNNDGKADGLDYVIWFNNYRSIVQIESSCLSQQGPLVTISGLQTSRYDMRSSPLAANTKVDARTASWEGIHDYPVIFFGGPDICWSGGTIQGLYPPDATWDFMHGTGAFNIYAPNTTVEGIRIDNYGDGIRVLDFAKDFTIRAVRLSYIRDDCVENDYLHSGLIEDSLFDGCYQGFSARTWSGQSNVTDGSNNLMTIRNSLIRLQPMEKVYQDRGLIPGHDGFFKWDQSGISPQLSLHNNIFRVDQASNNVGLGLPPGKLISCSNNIMVWLGTGLYPEVLPDTFNGRPCFTITTDQSVWDNAVSDWLAQH